VIFLSLCLSLENEAEFAWFDLFRQAEKFATEMKQPLETAVDNGLQWLV